MTKHTPAQTITPAQAAKLFDRSTRWVHQLRERGYIETVAPGRYPLVGLIRGALAYFDDMVAKQDSAAQDVAVTDARTREIEQRIRRKAMNLIPREIVHEVLDEMVAEITAEMRKVPANTFRDRRRRAELRAEVDTSLSRLKTMTADAKARLAKEGAI